MKLQVSGQQWRLRVSEDELQRLRDGHSLMNSSILPGDVVFRFELELVPAAQARIDRVGNSWKISLPMTSVEAYVLRLPCRDGVDFALPVQADLMLALAFEVDVRDSIRRRGARLRRD